MAYEIKSGMVGWVDLTVENAEETRDFYKKVIGWSSTGQSMGDYDDYNMQTPDGETIAGICHKKGMIAHIPSQWIVYFIVDDVVASLAACEANGGKRIGEIMQMEDGGIVIIQDPAGAVCALYQRATSE